MADAFGDALTRADKIAAIQTQLIAYTGAQEAAVTAACAVPGAGIKPQMRRVTYGAAAGGAAAPTFETVPINAMLAIPCKVTVDGGGYVCTQPATDLHNPDTATAIVKKVPFPEFMVNPLDGAGAITLVALQVVAFLGTALELGDTTTWLKLGDIMTVLKTIHAARLSDTVTNILANIDRQQQGERARQVAAAAQAAPVAKAMALHGQGGDSELFYAFLLNMRASFDSIKILTDIFFKPQVDGQPHPDHSVPSLE